MRAPRMGRVAHGRALAYFFFSSRRRHTRFDCDWSSDVCSSDLRTRWVVAAGAILGLAGLSLHWQILAIDLLVLAAYGLFRRSEERRVGKERRSRSSPRR